MASAWRPYLIAIVCLATAAVARVGLEPMFDGTLPWLTFWPAVFAAAWYGGARAGITTVVGATVLYTLWLESAKDAVAMSPAAHWVGATIFTTCGVGISLIAERALRASAREAQLRDQATRARSRLLEELERSPVGIGMLKGPSLSLSYVNQRARDLLAERGEAIGRPLLEVVPELRGQAVLAAIQQVYRTGVGIDRLQEPVLLERNGGDAEERWFRASYHPTHDDKGAIDGVIVSAVEITDLLQTTRSLEAARELAQEASQAKDEFLAMLGHELRNPLAPMVTALELLRRKGQRSRELELIERQVAHLTRLVDDLLDVSRIVRGKLELRVAAIDLADVIGKAIEVVTPMIERTGHQLEVKTRRDLVVYGDTARLTQVFANLLTNAIKYSEPGSRITIRAARQDGRAVVRVIDRGIGIAPELLDRVFDAFVQQPQAPDRAHGGLGLGLAIVKQLVTLHGGRVTAHSEGRGHGSELRVELPLAHEEVTPSLAPSPMATTAGQRVLVVDDNEDLAEAMASLLEAMGHEVRIAYDGPQALDAVSSFTPDIAFVDIGLPLMDGYELARRLRASGTPAHLVAVTGYGQERDREHSRAAGFEEHLVKPVNGQTLAQVIHRFTEPASAQA